MTAYRYVRLGMKPTRSEYNAIMLPPSSENSTIWESVHPIRTSYASTPLVTSRMKPIHQGMYQRRTFLVRWALSQVTRKRYAFFFFFHFQSHVTKNILDFPLHSLPLRVTHALCSHAHGLKRLQSPNTRLQGYRARRQTLWVVFNIKGKAECNTS